MKKTEEEEKTKSICISSFIGLLLAISEQFEFLLLIFGFDANIITLLESMSKLKAYT